MPNVRALFRLAALAVAASAPGSTFADIATTPGFVKRTITNPAPQVQAQSEQFGFSLAVHQGSVLIGAPVDSVDVRDGGSAFLADIATGEVLKEFSNPTPEIFGNFGNAVGWAGGTIAVAAERANDSGVSDSGAVFFYGGTNLQLMSSIVNPFPQEFDEFGHSLFAISDSTMLITAPQRRETLPTGGVAYIFDVVSQSRLQTIPNPTPSLRDDFGLASTSFSGGVIVTAPGDDASGTNAGVAYLFNPANGALLHTFNHPSPSPFDFFGVSVVASEEFIVFGAQDATDQFDGVGAAHVFSANTFDYLYSILNPEPSQSDLFGSSLAIQGDTLVIGAFRDAAGGSVHQYNLATAARQLSVANPLPTPLPSIGGEFFGFSVGISGSHIIAGAPFKVVDGKSSGAVLVIQGVPEPDAYLLAALALCARLSLRRRRVVAYDAVRDICEIAPDFGLYQSLSQMGEKLTLNKAQR